MGARIYSSLAIVFLGWGLYQPIFAMAEQRSLPLPAAPSSYVDDSSHVLQPPTVRVLERLLSLHDQKTGEQVVISIFPQLGEEDLVEWTNRIFQAWKIGRRGKDNGILLALYWKNRKVRIEVGYGLEGLLTDAKSKEIIAEDLVPRLKAGDPDQALILATLSIFREIHSPLIQSGEALEIIKSGGLSGRRLSRSTQSDWNQFLPLGLILLVLFLNWLNRNRGGPWRGGGGWGGGSWGSGDRGGDSGGFSGGGGSSGGGGASGDW